MFFHSDYCNTLLNEIRACAIDNIIHYPSLKVRYVGINYVMSSGGLPTVISEIVRESTFKSTKRATDSDDLTFENRPIFASVKGKERAVEGLNGEPVDSELTDAYSSSSDDDDDDLDILGNNSVKIINGIKFKDVKESRLWQKEVWGLTL